jgi:hypothetical protein
LCSWDLTIFHLADGDLATADAGVGAALPIGPDAFLAIAVAGLVSV